MPVNNYQVGVGADDGSWFSTTFSNNAPTERVGKQTTVSNNIFARFDNVEMEGTINSAVLSVRSAHTNSDVVPVRIYGELANDPAAPTTAADANGRTLTTAFVDWSPGSWTNGVYVDTPDLSSIFQELIDQGYTYDGNQAVQLFLLDNGAANFVTKNIRTYDHDSVNSPPLLEVDFTTANAPPTITAITADMTTFATAFPSLLFEGFDAEGNPLTFDIEISDASDFPSTVTARDQNAGTGGLIHPNPLLATLTHEGNVQVDDRPCQSFQATGGIIDSVTVYYNGDTLADGLARIRIYDHDGVFGTSSAPLNAAARPDTPTLGWLATSDTLYADNTTPAGAKTFTFSGSDRIRLEPGQYYVLEVDWLANSDDYDNTIEIVGDIALNHAGNAYVDGDSPNHGVNLTFDLPFIVYEANTLITASSDTDPGFANTEDGADTDPFTEDQVISYTVQSALDDGVTYYWRVRATDPGGSGVPSSYTATREFTINLSGGSGGSATKRVPKLQIGLMI